MIKIHKEGRLIVAITLVVLLVLIASASLLSSPVVNYITSIASGIILILVLRFFRVPGKHGFKDEKVLVAPADGKVVAIEKVNQPEYIEGPCIQMSIFMSMHDVHINFFPSDGHVDYVKYHPGKYFLARHPKSSELNERFSTGISTQHGKYLVRQVAGYVARRIKSYAQEGGKAIQGNEMGFIKFGSRMDLFLPMDTQIIVELNQRVTGGLTPVALIK